MSIISSTTFVGLALSVVVSLIVDYGMDFFAAINITDLEACAQLMDPGDFMKVTHRYVNGEYDRQYITYTPASSVFANPVSGVYGYWYPDTYEVLYPIM